MAGKTLLEAGAKTNAGVLPTSQSITQTSQIASPQIKAGDTLSKDLLSILGTTGAIVQETNTLSIKAAQRVGTDSLSQMSIDLDALEGSLTPETNLRETQVEAEAIYQSYGRKTFDNDDAQRAFDDMYHKEAAPTIARKNAKWEVKANEKDATALFNKSVFDVETQMKAGLGLTNERYNQYVEQMTAGGYFTKDQAGGSLIKIVNQNIEGVYKTLDDLDVYQENGITLDRTKLDREANTYYRGVAIVKDGQWVGKKGVPTAVVSSAQDTFNKLIDNNRKVRTQKAGFSAIPDAKSSMKFDGSMDAETARRSSETAKIELEEKVRLFPEIVNDLKFKGWQLDQQQMDAKASILENMTTNFQEFAVGTITWQDYLNNTAKTSKSFSFAGQSISESASIGDVTSFAQKQFDNYDDELRGANYSEYMQTAKGNPFASSARVEMDSGGVLKSKYLQRNAAMLSNGNIVGDSFASLQSEFHKTVDYMSTKKTLEDSWVTETNKKNINVMFNTLSARIERKEINEQQGFIKARSTMEAWENTINFSKQKVDTEKLAAINEAFSSFDAETANDEGWTNFGFGDEVYPAGTKALIVQRFQGDLTSTTNPKLMRKNIAGTVVPLRSRSGTSAVFTLPWRETFMLYVGDRGEITQDGASLVIAQRIENDLGEKFADITDDTLSIRQDKDDNGEIITTVALRLSVGADPLRLYAFSMDELAKGEEVQNAKKINKDDQTSITQEENLSTFLKDN